VVKGPGIAPGPFAVGAAPARRRELTAAVDALDAVERPFALFDRERFGPVSRDRCVTTVRERFNLQSSPLSLVA
jgi:Family of unknown function (DUF6058)